MMIRILAFAQFVLLFLATAAHAQQGGQLELILTTAPGVSEIEAGQIDAGIQRLERSRNLSNLKAPVSINLCAAYILKRDFEQAEASCNHAVRSNPRVGNSWFGSDSAAAYNNRGVLRALQGDFEDAISDFRHARRVRDGAIPAVGFAQREAPNGNLQLTEQLLAAIRQTEEQRQVAVTRN